MNSNISGEETSNKAKTSIPVLEEELQVDKKIVETGKVVISKKVNEEDVTINVPIVHEEVEVKRIEVNQYVDSAPEIRYEGETTIVPVLKEVAVVEKRLMLVEELHITKRHVQTHQAHTQTLKNEEVIINREKS